MRPDPTFNAGASAYDLVTGRWSRVSGRHLLAAARVGAGQPCSKCPRVPAGWRRRPLRRSARRASDRHGSRFPMLRVAQGKIAGLPVCAVVMDGQALACRAESVDVVLCQLGLMFFPDAERGLREFRRVFRPRGRLAVQVWSVPERVHYLGMLADALSRRTSRTSATIFMPPPAWRIPRVFTRCSPARAFRTSPLWRATQRSPSTRSTSTGAGSRRAAATGQFYVDLPADARRAIRAEVSARMARLESAGRLILSRKR